MVTKRDLDAWADALDAGNDGEAIGQLRGVIARLVIAADAVATVEVALGNLRTQEPIAGLQRAGGHLEEAQTALVQLMRSFSLHERGR
ncbi:hypothetical protein GCM10029976_078310 [Kribbella albertanoniae]|uniref:Uncharacterized protein n=1 Tax=Kribbella albertanoniae TaxID=1266829 RepID=A0A4R4PM55_9ACTN|nr:hypothetical protein [Kribbella albertanoniae]TDC23192.1 hypothetical protein E1261_29030 [Kribbella albertanoniae]